MQMKTFAAPTRHLILLAEMLRLLTNPFVIAVLLRSGTDSLGTPDLTYRKVARSHKAMYAEPPFPVG